LKAVTQYLEVFGTTASIYGQFTAESTTKSHLNKGLAKTVTIFGQICWQTGLLDF
jgi:hypothetical protein